jgi:HAD superfamily hydrolase (TIGR01509 family)
MPSRPAAAVFDSDGLLLDTEVAWTRAETRLFAAHGRTFTPEHKRALIGTSHHVAAARLAELLDQPGRGEALVQELYVLVHEEAEVGIDPRPGAVALLDAIEAAGLPVAVASNSLRSFLDTALASSGLADRFVTTISADEVAEPKPAPDLYLEACRRLGVDPGEAVALEDSPTGVAAARAAGLRIVGVPYLPELADQLATDLVARRLDDVEVRAFLGVG